MRPAVRSLKSLTSRNHWISPSYGPYRILKVETCNPEKDCWWFLQMDCFIFDDFCIIFIWFTFSLFVFWKRINLSWQFHWNRSNLYHPLLVTFWSIRLSWCWVGTISAIGTSLKNLFQVLRKWTAFKVPDRERSFNDRPLSTPSTYGTVHFRHRPFSVPSSFRTVHFHDRPNPYKAYNRISNVWNL